MLRKDRTAAERKMVLRIQLQFDSYGAFFLMGKDIFKNTQRLKPPEHK